MLLFGNWGASGASDGHVARLWAKTPKRAVRWPLFAATAQMPLRRS